MHVILRKLPVCEVGGYSGVYDDDDVCIATTIPVIFLLCADTDATVRCRCVGYPAGAPLHVGFVPLVSSDTAVGVCEGPALIGWGSWSK